MAKIDNKVARALCGTMIGKRHDGSPAEQELVSFFSEESGSKHFNFCRP